MCVRLNECLSKLARGRLVRACPLEDLVASRSAHVLVRSADAARLAAALADGVEGRRPSGTRLVGDDELTVEGLPIALVGRAALRAGIELHELREERTDLEDVFLALTADAPAHETTDGTPDAAMDGPSS